MMNLTPIDRFLEALRVLDLDYKLVNRDNHWMTQCPSHNDRVPSLSVREMSNGVLLFNCFAGCPREQVLKDLGLEWPQLFPDYKEQAEWIAEKKDWVGELRLLWRSDICPTCGGTKL